MKNLLILLLTLVFILLFRTEYVENYTNKQIDYYRKVWLHNDEIEAQFSLGKSLIDEFYKKLGKKGKVLNIGCGTATYLTAMEKKYPKFNYYGIDNDRSMVTEARSKCPMCKIEYGNALDKNAFEPEDFDIIILAKETLHLIDYDDWNTLFFNINFWMRPHALLIINIYEPNKLDAGPEDYSLMKPTKEGNKISSTFYDGFFHNAQFKQVKDNEYMLEEVYKAGKKFNDYDTRFYVPSLKDSLAKIRKNGFELLKIDDMKKLSNTLDFKAYYFQKKV